MFTNNISVIVLKKGKITDFAKERNELLEKAGSDWVFFLDSDEELHLSLKEELETLNIDGYAGFYVFRKNYFLGKFIGTDKILRLGRKNAGRWKRRVHEVWEIKGKTGTLKNPVIHNSVKSLKEFIAKLNLYSGLHAEENLSNGNKSTLFKIIFYPPAKFFQSILAGRGFVFSMLQSLHSFLSWSKEWEFQKK